MKRKTVLVPPDDIRQRYAEVLPPSQALALEVLFMLRTCVHTLDHVLTRWLGNDALTPGRLQVLAVLWSRGKALPQREIVETLKVSRATVSELVELLAREGHILVKPSTKDKRLTLVELTKSGRSLTEKLIRQNAQRLRGVLGDLTDAELKKLIGLLSHLLQDAETHADP